MSLLTRFLLACLLLLPLPAQLRAQDIGIAVGAKAPGAVVETLEGRPVDLARYVGGTPVLLEFWATWCGYCKDLEPAVQALRRTYGDRLKLVGVAVGVNQSPERVRRYAERHQLPLEVLYDRTGAAVTAYKVPTTSFVVVIDRTGKVVYTGVGGEQDLEAAVRKAM